MLVRIAGVAGSPGAGRALIDIEHTLRAAGSPVQRWGADRAPATQAAVSAAIMRSSSAATTSARIAEPSVLMTPSGPA